LPDDGHNQLRKEMPPALQRRAEEVHDCWSLASRHPQVADAGLRRGDWERRAIVPAAWQKIVKQVGKIFDGLRFSKRQHQKRSLLIANRS